MLRVVRFIRKILYMYENVGRTSRSRRTLNPCPNPMDVGWAAKALDSLDFRHKMLMLHHRQRVCT